MSALKSDAVFAELQSILESDPSVVDSIDGAFRIDITNDHGKELKSWFLNLSTHILPRATDQARIFSLSPTDPHPSVLDTILKCSDHGFHALYRGNKKIGFKLYRQGLIKWEGSTSQARKLLTLIQQKKKEHAIRDSPIVDILPVEQWVSDGSAKGCFQCSREFGLFRRRHHCRVCGRVFCGDCSSQRLAVKGSQPTFVDNVRVCDGCYMQFQIKSATSRRSTTLTSFSQDFERTSDVSLRGTMLSSFPSPSSSAQHEPGTNYHTNNYTNSSYINNNNNNNSNSPQAAATATALTVHQQQYRQQQQQQQLQDDDDDEEEEEGELTTAVSSRQHSTSMLLQKKIHKLEKQIEVLAQCVQGDNLRASMWSPLTLCCLAAMVVYSSYSIAGVLFTAGWILLLILPYLACGLISRWDEGLFKRRLKVYWIAIRTIYVFRRTKYTVKDMSQEDKEAIWLSVHTQYAKYLYTNFLQLRGFWIKIGQFFGSRADLVPEPFITELSKLQDSLPANSIEEIRLTIEQELSASIESVFASFDPTPLASASIAQVHKATLVGSHEQVIVKVQHRNVDVIMKQDLHNLSRIISWIAWLEPDMDFKPIVDEWTTAVMRELDFKIEADVTETVRANLSRFRQQFPDPSSPYHVSVDIPRIYRNLTTSKMLVEEFVDGFKVTDIETLDTENVDKVVLLQSICRCYAQQIFVDGLFNADPHPGNILVRKTEDGVYRAVLLDFGLHRSLDDAMRFAFAKMVYSAWDMDFAGLLESFDEMGLKLNREDPSADMEGVRFLLRDASPAAEAKQETKRHRERMSKRRKDLESKEKDKKKRRKIRNPVDAFPGSLLFFLRVIGLLRGLAANLSLSQPYLAVIAPFAKLALLQKQSGASGHVNNYSNSNNSINNNSNSFQQLVNHLSVKAFPMQISTAGTVFMEQRVSSYIRELYTHKDILGIQITAFKNGQCVLDVSGGFIGPLDNRLVSPETLFVGYLLSQTVTALLVHILVDRKVIHYEATVASYWPEFASSDIHKKSITVKQLLMQRSALHKALPSPFTSSTLCDADAMLKAVETGHCDHVPDERIAIHYFTYGYLVAGLLQHVTKKPLQTLLSELLTTPLGLEEDMFFQLPDSISANSKRLSTVDCNLFNSRPGNQLDDDSDNKQFHLLEVAERFGMLDVLPLLTGTEWLLDPRLFNRQHIRRSFIPSLNLHATSKAMATVFSLLANNGCFNGQQIFSANLPLHLLETTVRQSRRRWSMGMNLFNFKQLNSESTSGSLLSPSGTIRSREIATACTGIGQVGFGGSLVLAVPGKNVALALMVNRFNQDSSSVITLANLITAELGVGVSADLLL